MIKNASKKESKFKRICWNKFNLDEWWVQLLLESAKSRKCRKCKVKNCLSKIINILITNHFYVFPCYNDRVCSFLVSLNSSEALNNFFKSSVIRQKGESHNGCFKKTKNAKFSETRTFLTPWYAHVHMCACQGVRNFLFWGTLACFVFLKHKFWDSPFCHITDETASETAHTSKTNKIIAYWTESARELFRLDCGFKFYRIHQNLTSIQINVEISSMNAIRDESEEIRLSVNVV